MSSGWLEVTQVRSAIGTKPKHRGTLRALGLRGLHRSRLLPDRPEIRGMLERVPHLVTVVEVEDAERIAAARQAREARATRGQRSGREVENA